MSLVVIDVGTSSIRGTLFNDNFTQAANCRITYEPVKFNDGRVEQCADTWTDNLLNILRKMVAEVSNNSGCSTIEAIVLTAARSSVLALDADGKPLCDAIMWHDTRNAALCEELRRYDDLVFRKSGARVNAVFSGEKMAWIQRYCPEIASRTVHYATIADYLIFCMTGEYHMDLTYGSRTNLMDLHTEKWDDELLSLFGIRRDQLPELIRPGTCAGKITASYAEASGLKVGVPVISAGGDQQCASIGLGALQNGTMSIVAGTGAFVEVQCDHIPEKLRNNMICNVAASYGSYIIETNVLACSSAFEWFLKTLRGMKIPDYAAVCQEVEEIYDKPTECLVLPYFQGRGTPDWNMDAKAAFLKISLSTGSAEMLKALLEGICLEISENINQLDKYILIRQIMISGGLTNSMMFNRMLTDVCGRKMGRMQNSESTTTGALMIGMLALGYVDTLEAAWKIVSTGFNTEYFEPDQEKHKEYVKKQAETEKLYRRLYR